MKVIIEYLDGKTEDREGFYAFDIVGKRVTLDYEDEEEIGVLEIPKRAIKEIRITDFQS